MKAAGLLAIVSLGALASTALAGPKTPPKKDPPKPAPAPAAPDEPPAKPFPSGTDHRRIIGVLDVRIDGAPPEIGAQFQRDLEAQVDNVHYFLAPRMRMHDRMANSTKWTEGCVIGGCLREVKTQTGADVVLLAALTGSGTSFGWVVTLVGTNKGVVIGQQSERCDVCTVSEALNAATVATLKLLNNIPEVLDGEATLIGPPPLTKPLEDKITAMHHTQKVAGTSLVVAGLAVAAAGAAYYFANNHDNNGLAIASVGGGVLIGGVITLAF